MDEKNSKVVPYSVFDPISWPSRGCLHIVLLSLFEVVDALSTIVISGQQSRIPMDINTEKATSGFNVQ